jgi:hypothetical protein
LESTSSKLNFDPVCLQRPFDPLIEEFLAESQMLDTGAGVTGKKKSRCIFVGVLISVVVEQSILLDSSSSFCELMA